MVKKSKKKLIANIIFYTVAALLYIFIGYELVCKFTGNNVYLFGNRFDVVLTGSMSTKNENHLDFLEGTNQIQPFDLVVSNKITKDTKLEEKDIVLFKNPDLNGQTDMHRIVQVVEKGDEVDFLNVDLIDFNNKKGIEFISYGSCIAVSSVPLSKVTLKFISNKPYNSNYSFCIGATYVEPTSHSSIELKEDLYEHEMVYERTGTYPVKVEFRSTILDIKSYITSIFLECGEKNVDIRAEDYIPTDQKSNTKIYNPYYLYEIRGDAAKDSDGTFMKEELISKVVGVVPKLGYFVRFISSIPGIILIIGLALLFTIFAYLYNKPEKDKTSKMVEQTVNKDIEISKNPKEKRGKGKNKKDEKV